MSNIYLKLLLLQPFPTILLVPRARNLGDYFFHTLYPVHKEILSARSSKYIQNTTTSWHLPCYQTGKATFIFLLDYCSSLLSGLFTYNLRVVSQHSNQNIPLEKRWDYINPLLKTVQELSILLPIKARVLIVASTTLHNMTLYSFSDLASYCSHTCRLHFSCTCFFAVSNISGPGCSASDTFPLDSCMVNNHLFSGFCLLSPSVWSLSWSPYLKSHNFPYTMFFGSPLFFSILSLSLLHGTYF